jgi:iron-sulfur cluster assembly protein
MITMTEEAASLIVSLVNDTDLPNSAGLRLGTDPFRGSLAMSLSRIPNPDDIVVDHDGAQLFLSPTVADMLTNQTLRAQLMERPAFYLTS